ncbi:MAG TPA: NADH-quinone oxidoreductase subunit C [Candidatus Sulfotelmatobacter sp.]|nr:NADH-quinone oxidoreductase subunit C [Candidatus Sulfotelmatobacter sp.]HUI75547.1 NADH-quinone oxidoreductase subunit C [Candidatus Acidoferrum sp.]
MSISAPVVSAAERVDERKLVEGIQERFGPGVSISRGEGGISISIALHEAGLLPELSKCLFWEMGCSWGGFVAEEHESHWRLSYVFLASRLGWIEVLLHVPSGAHRIPSISSGVHAADWHEREVEDLFGLSFEGHPRLGDFILHDQVWPEGVAPHRKPHRKTMDVQQTHLRHRPNPDWRPLLVVQDPGAFAMPVGPVYEGGIGESLHFLLETVGEDVVRAIPRLFYNFRAVEKIAEGRSVPEGLLLAERFAATSAFAHSMGFASAIERLRNVEVPERAKRLRVVLAELERLRHHTATITDICGSTALAVAASQASIVEEELLRASCAFSGHRYLFGLNKVGGLSRDFGAMALGRLQRSVNEAAERLHVLEDRLYFTSSFLDRLEDAGVVIPEKARDLNLLGPVGRASGQGHDLRQECAYNEYETYEFEVPRESEGDGYARLRVLFQEAYQSARMITQAIDRLEAGPVLVPEDRGSSGVGMGWVEAPNGAALHWVRLDNSGRIERYHAMTPSFNNWLGFHVAVEEFAFQDFPIILATFGLSATECDR